MILAIDPGVASGYALWQGKIDAVEFGVLDQMSICRYAFDVVEFCNQIVCESFRINAQTHKKSFQPASLEIIGMLRYLCCEEQIEFVLQSPVEAKGFMTDSKIKSLGWWHPEDGGHATDAARHLGLYLCKQGNREILSVT